VTGLEENICGSKMTKLTVEGRGRRRSEEKEKRALIAEEEQIYSTSILSIHHILVFGTVSASFLAS